MPWTFFDSSGRKLNTSSTSVADLDIDGATDIGADIVDADLFIIDDGAGGTNRKTAASRIKTYVGSAIAWEGSQTTETTSSSASSTDILTSSTLSIAQTSPFQLIIGGRKTDAGTANWGGLGLKINSTVISVAATNTSTIWSTNRDDDRASRGTGYSIFHSRVANYLAAGAGSYAAYHASGIEIAQDAAPNSNGVDFPTATITALVVSAVSEGGGNVVGGDEFQIYKLTTS